MFQWRKQQQRNHILLGCVQWSQKLGQGCGQSKAAYPEAMMQPRPLLTVQQRKYTSLVTVLQ